MTAPMVAVGDGALGSWLGLGDVFPETVQQQCLPHKTANILDALPKRLHRQAKAAIHEICQAETRAEANAGIDDFVRVPCCTLGAPATNEPDRVDLRNGKGKK